MSNMFEVDPFAIAERIYSQRCMRMVAAVMKACGVTQVDISQVQLLSDDTLVLDENYERGFLRIRGEFKMDPKP